MNQTCVQRWLPLIWLTALVGVVVLPLGCDNNNPSSPDDRSSSSFSSQGPSSSSGPALSSSLSSTQSPVSSSLNKSSSSSLAPSSSSVAALSSSLLSSSSQEPGPQSSSLSSSSQQVLASSSSSSSPLESSSSLRSSSSKWPPFSGGKSYSQMTDPRDGQVYTTLLLGSWTVLAQNLNYGVQVPGSDSAQNQSNDGVAEKFCYNDDSTNCQLYGGLYQWAEAMGLPYECNYKSCADSIDTTGFYQGICPPGWHVLSLQEWNTCASEGYGAGGGSSLKATSGWGLGPGNNSSGMTALPAGERRGGGFFVGFLRNLYRPTREA